MRIITTLTFCGLALFATAQNLPYQNPELSAKERAVKHQGEEVG